MTANFSLGQLLKADELNSALASANVFNVKGLGVVGNGSADDYPAIKAIDASVASAGGGTLYFPASTYFASLALQPSSGVNYQGASKALGLVRPPSTCHS